MIDDPLPFERAFLQWADQHGNQIERIPLPTSESDEVGTGYRLTPSRSPQCVVVTLHGAGNDAFFAWVGLFKRLLELGVEVVTFNLPGHGRSDQTLFSLAAARASLQAAVRRSQAFRSDLPIHAVGVSLGGAVLLSSLPRAEGISSAVLMVAPLQICFSTGAVANELRLRTLRLVVREREHYGLTGLIPSFGPFKRKAYPLRLATRAFPGAFGYIRALNAELQAMNLEKAARRCRVPVLLIYGERDRVVPIGQGERLCRLIRSAELIRVKEGTHLSTPLEQESVDRLLNWLNLEP